jgi:Ribbon-helix-helix protein, copG family
MRKDHHIAVRCDSELLELLGDIAQANGEPVSAVVRDAIRQYRNEKPKPGADEAVALVGALVEAIGDAGVRKRFLALCKAANEIHVRIGNPPSAAIGLVTAALQREPAQ